MLVYENYNKFISATETIKRMKANVEAMDDDMEAVKWVPDSVIHKLISANFADVFQAEDGSHLDKLLTIGRISGGEEGQGLMHKKEWFLKTLSSSIEYNLIVILFRLTSWCGFVGYFKSWNSCPNCPRSWSSSSTTNSTSEQFNCMARLSMF